MIEEAYRSNAAIVGPKLVDYDDPRLLLEVGMSIDRYGTPHSGLEAGEMDQEQHDAVRDVFFVSSAALLVRADLFAELGGFDPGAFPGSEDLDLCWRALIAGARVLVAPDARARHRAAAEERGVDDEPDLAARERTRLRTVLVARSRASLALAVPLGFVHSTVEAVAALVTRQRPRAKAVMGAWVANLRHLGDLRRARRRAQALRRVPDRELRPLQRRGSTRARQFVAVQLRPEERVRGLGDRGRAVAVSAQGGFRQPAMLAVVAAAVLYLFGSRELLSQGIPQVGVGGHWPGISEFFAAFGSGWRFTGVGSPTPAPPAFALFGALSMVIFGSAGLAQSLFVLACIPVGAVGVARLVRRSATSWPPACLAGAVYAVLPLGRNAIANGQFGPLVLFALLPFFVDLLVAERTRRNDITLAVLGALMTATYIPSLLAGLVVAVALALAAALVGGLDVARRALRGTGVAALGALVLLVPWSVGMLVGRPDAGALGLGYRPRLTLGETLRFESGPSGAAWIGLFFFLAGLLVLLVGQDERFTWGVRAWALVLVGIVITWLPYRLQLDVPTPAAEACLLVIALGLAVAVGLGLAAFFIDLRDEHFGWRQLVSVLAFAALGLAGLPFVADSIGGWWHAPRRGWNDALAFSEPDRRGDSRVLFVGDPVAIPYDPSVAHGVAWSLTADGPGDARDQWRAPDQTGDELVGQALEQVMGEHTDRLGHLVAPMGVRWIVVPHRVGPRAGTPAPPPDGLVAGLDAQLDLARRVSTDDDFVVYQNLAWVPTAAVVPGISLGADAIADARDAEVSKAKPLRGDVGPGVVLWSRTSSSGWEARANGKQLDRKTTFGWANGFNLPAKGDVTITWAQQWQRNVVLLTLLCIALGALTFGWSRRRSTTTETVDA
jgi:hypothetical protein